MAYSDAALVTDTRNAFDAIRNDGFWPSSGSAFGGPYVARNLRKASASCNKLLRSRPTISYIGIADLILLDGCGEPTKAQLQRYLSDRSLIHRIAPADCKVLVWSSAQVNEVMNRSDKVPEKRAPKELPVVRDDQASVLGRTTKGGQSLQPRLKEENVSHIYPKGHPTRKMVLKQLTDRNLLIEGDKWTASKVLRTSSGLLKFVCESNKTFARNRGVEKLKRRTIELQEPVFAPADQSREGSKVSAAVFLVSSDDENSQAEAYVNKRLKTKETIDLS